MLHITLFSPASCHFFSLRSKYSSQHPALKHPQFLFLMWETKFHTRTKQQVKFILVYFNLYAFRKLSGRQKILNCMVASIFLRF
jgi:hypothetical protein